MFEHEKIINDIESLRKEVKYSIIDFPIESIVSNLKKGRFFIPDYQENIFGIMKRNQNLLNLF